MREKDFNKCLICNHASLESLKGYEAHFLSRCSNCGFVFATRRPTDEELSAHYNNYSRNDYLSPITIKRYHEILDRFEAVRSTNRLLDVGCGIGYFLDVAKQRGWEVYGTEYTDKAIEICASKGITMHKGVLDPKNYPAESFDVITSFEVIEHINQPNPEIANMVSLLRKGGYLYITTPNFNSLLRYHLKGAYNVICWPEHLSYYTPATLHRLMKRHGLKKKFIQSTGISLTRLLSSNKAPRTEDISEGTAFIAKDTHDEKLRNRAESNLFIRWAKHSLNALLTFTGKGDALKGLFQKS